MTVAFDTLAYAKELEAAGFTAQQAEVQAKGLAQLIDEKLATKADLKELEIELKRDINDVKRDIGELEQRLTYKLTLRMGTMLAASVAVITALVKII